MSEQDDSYSVEYATMVAMSFLFNMTCEYRESSGVAGVAMRSRVTDICAGELVAGKAETILDFSSGILMFTFCFPYV